MLRECDTGPRDKFVRWTDPYSTILETRHNAMDKSVSAGSEVRTASDHEQYYLLVCVVV
jgi:hypothetical protein